MINMTTAGFDTILVGSFGCSFAQTAVIAAMFFKLRDAKKKALAIPAIVSGVCGVTEPAIYGFSLPEKTPFIFSMIGGSAGGALFALLNGKGYTMGGLGIFGVVNYISPTGDASGMYASFACIAVSMIIGFVLTFFFWKDKSEDMKPVTVETKNPVKVSKEVIVSPIEGKVKPLSEVKDAAFAGGALGKGIAIEPANGKVIAPFDGTIMTLFPTKHAIGLVSDNGCEVLIHIGLDTVQLEGKHFEAHVKQGDKVTKGQLLVSFDKAAIEKEGYCVDTPIIITNTNDYLDIVETQEASVKANDSLITVLL